MANKHSLLDSNYMIQVKTESGTQTSYNNIKLMDAESSYFITADEIVRCLCETLKPSTTPSNESNAENESTSTQKDLLSGKHHVTIEISNYGTIYAELDADVAPITVTNFINLSKEGFYDGLK